MREADVMTQAKRLPGLKAALLVVQKQALDSFASRCTGMLVVMRMRGDEELVVHVIGSKVGQ